MNLSRETKLVTGITVLAIPTIMFGGVTLLGIVTGGTAGSTPGDLSLDDAQMALWRAGHAHAGVWVILSLILQILIDSSKLPISAKWVARISAPVSAVAVSGGFFGLAFMPGFRWLIYVGAFLLLVALIITGIGLLRNLNDKS